MANLRAAAEAAADEAMKLAEEASVNADDNL